MDGYAKGKLIRLTVFLLLMAAGTVFWNAHKASDEARIRDEAERLLSAEEFLLEMLDQMRQGTEQDWTEQAARHGLEGFVSVRYEQELDGVCLMNWTGFPYAKGWLVTEECVTDVPGWMAAEVEVMNEGKGVYLYRITYYWD